jgi:hypothetical protein
MQQRARLLRTKGSRAARFMRGCELGVCWLWCCEAEHTHTQKSLPSKSGQRLIGAHGGLLGFAGRRVGACFAAEPAPSRHALESRLNHSLAPGSRARDADPSSCRYHQPPRDSAHPACRRHRPPGPAGGGPGGSEAAGSARHCVGAEASRRADELAVEQPVRQMEAQLAVGRAASGKLWACALWPSSILTGCGGSVSLLVRPKFTLLYFTWPSSPRLEARSGGGRCLPAAIAVNMGLALFGERRRSGALRLPSLTTWP